MNWIAGLWTILLPALSFVQTLEVAPVGERTQVTIGVEGPVVVRDFVLREPARIVVDFEGATHEFTRTQFMDIARGGVRSIRVSQFRSAVVRVVVDLDRPVEYSIGRSGDAVRVSFMNPSGPFERWASGPPRTADAEPGADAADAPGRAAPAPSAQPAAEEPVTITTRARRRAEPEPPRQTTAVSSVPQRAAQPRITVNFSEAPIREVLTTFAEFSDRSIVFGPDITGTVTADIRNQPWDVALEAILAAHGLAATELEHGIIRVDEVEQLRQTQRPGRLITRTIPVRYASVDSVLPAVQQIVCDMSWPTVRSDSATQTPEQLAFLALSRGGSGGQQCRGGVAKNGSTNALIITASESAMPGIEETVRQLDVRTAQVTINAKIIFVDKTRLEGLGVTYDLKDSQGNQLNQLVPGIADLDGDGTLDDSERRIREPVFLLGGTSVAALANATSRIPSAALQVVTSLVLNRHSLITFLDALQSRQFTEVQAHPAVSVMDHRSARVQVGEETPVRVVDAGAGGAGGGGQGGQGSPAFPRATVEFRETGIILEVTPHITGDQVLLELHAERSNVGLAPSDVGVVFNTQEAQTHVLVNDGETAVIGGLTIIEKSEVENGIPLLMNLPLVGSLFRTTQQEETKQDLLIMVTPHIVREGEA